LPCPSQPCPHFILYYYLVLHFVCIHSGTRLLRYTTALPFLPLISLFLLDCCCAGTGRSSPELLPTERKPVHSALRLPFTFPHLIAYPITFAPSPYVYLCRTYYLPFLHLRRSAWFFVLRGRCAVSAGWAAVAGGGI